MSETPTEAPAPPTVDALVAEHNAAITAHQEASARVARLWSDARDAEAQLTAALARRDAAAKALAEGTV